ncbi:SufD family Fe-S cluster assembly protein, partial [Salmonella enterica subsp. enterica serovar Kentucky]|nr:SufD family Fe-S cluster assembly protein [Salmonella enterica subsp. enterica serovar Kentucky]
RTQAWLESLRPKTLPLAFAAIIVGTALAWWQGYFDPLVALLAQMTNNNLLLGKLAEVDTKPQLEIYADDVKCSHGATIGRIDDE